MYSGGQWEDAWSNKLKPPIGSTVYYWYGNEYDSVTGGWSQNGYVYYPESNYYLGDLIKYYDHMYIDGHDTIRPEWNYKQGGVGTANTFVDLANKYIYLIADVYVSENTYFGFAGITNKANVVASVQYQIYTYNNTLSLIGTTADGHSLYKGQVPNNNTPVYLYIQSVGSEMDIYGVYILNS